MQSQWKMQYNELLTKLGECRRKSYDNAAYIECCFVASSVAMEKLMNNVLKEEFENSEEEIHFLKTIKPKFSSRVQYYSLLYQAELFKPEADEANLKKFWKHELNRLPKFIKNNLPFYEYYKSGDPKYDHIYFVRSNPKEAKRETESLCKTYDHLVASIIALEDYQEYVGQQLKILN